jgi:uncharacterized protein (TIGR00661 family)
MKFLYAIQGTGNGHVARARDIVPALKAQGVDLDVLISGTQSQVQLPFALDYQFKGFSFHLNKRGGIDYGQSLWANLDRHLWREIRQLEVEKYDLVVNDFEPVSAWAARLKGVPCVAFGHQAAFLSEQTPRPVRKDRFGEAVLRRYAPAQKGIGFHFQAYDQDIYTPVIRREVRELQVRNKGHFTVYLPAISDNRLIRVLSHLPEVDWQVFSRHTWGRYRVKNVLVRPVDSQAFVESMTSAEGVLTGGGFETPSECLYLGKKLFVVPIKKQYEQSCNAAALAQMGVPVQKELNLDSVVALREWIWHHQAIQFNYPDQTQTIIERLISDQNCRRETVAKFTIS